MYKEQEFVGLLNREMERLQGYLKGKKEPQTAIECEELVRPFVYKIEELTAHNYIKDQRIAELEEQLANSIKPKFPRQEHICSFAFGEIREYIVVAYLDNNITLCENIETSELEWCDNNFLVRTFEEAQAKLQELQGEYHEGKGQNKLS